MLDARLIRNEPDRVREGLAAKNVDPDGVDRWRELDARRRDALTRVEALKADRNAASRRIGEVRKGGGDAAAEQDRVRALGEEIRDLDDAVRGIEADMHELAVRFPNLPHPTTPRGGPEANTVVRTWGEPIRHPFPARQHDEIGQALGITDFERATRMSGPGFSVLTGAGAKLNRALINYMLDLHASRHGYTEVSIPYLVKRDSLFGTGQLPKLEEDMYLAERDDLFLIPTAEVSVTNLHREETLDERDLPRYYVAYSACFRREAGSYGKDTRGLTRVHQFDKVELVKFVHPSVSYDELESLLGCAETVLRNLGLPYRVLLLASGDISFAAAKCYDLEVWAPGAGRWLEVSSCSNFEDFQARRAEIRYRPEGGGSRNTCTP